MAQLDHDHAHGEHTRRFVGTPAIIMARAQVASCCGGEHGDADKAVSAATAIDPVCGMRVDPATARHRATYQGKDYFFCSGRCRERFEAEPEKFLQPKPAEPAAPAGTIYTCPMHPEVRQVGPGSCPICGMALEPEQVSLDDAPDPELADMTRRFWIALALTLPVFAIEMGSHLGLMHLVPPGWSNWISSGVVDAGGAVGGRAVFRARLAFAGHPQPQHVHADRDGHRRGLGLQRGRHAGAAMVSGRRSATATAWSRCISRRRPSLRFWCCWARCWSCGRGRALRARSARCSGWRRKPRGASARKVSREWRRGCRDRCDRDRRSLAGAARRENSGRWHRHRGKFLRG